MLTRVIYIILHIRTTSIVLRTAKFIEGERIWKSFTAMAMRLSIPIKSLHSDRIQSVQYELAEAVGVRYGVTNDRT